ncbi:threonine/serine exporter family protein [Microbacterium oryzae]|uniref:Threonine/serine exporter family protein n=1 Tax=Microbacterium oryzae TaxID=743009 RepID=A0A6I6E1S2_9MICO|nr:threonine/serine exporter family protein [Microbacterium oryzae]QGU28084.1 threonine/serine exporter family protein [Microbacterium oryzae]
MAQDRHRRVMESVRRALWSDSSHAAPTEMLTVIDDAMVVRIIDLAMRVCEVMLSVGASAKEVVLAALRITGAYGLKSVHVNVTYNSVTVSDHRGGDGHPVTLMQVVRSAVPDHAKLQRLQALVTDIEEGLDLREARTRFREIRRTPFLYRPGVVIFAQAMLAVGVGVMFGASWIVLVVTFLAALGVAGSQAGLAKLRVPMFFTQISGAFVLTIATVITAVLAQMGVEPFTDVRPTIVVSSGIVLMLAGLAVVGAAQDAIDGFALTAGGRILELTLQTLGVVLGIVVGLQLASALGVGLQLPAEALPLGSFPGQIIGAILVAVTVAVVNGAGLRIVVVSVVLAAIGWIGYAIPSTAGIDAAASSFVGAFAASLFGAFIAYRLRVPSVAVTTAAIVPLVPGSAVFRGLLGFVEAGDDTGRLIVAAQALVTAGMIGIALAAGATLGLFIGSPLRASLDGVRMRVRTTARPRAAAGAGRIVAVPRREEGEPGAAAPGQ